jgi:hypothetical protein
MAKPSHKTWIYGVRGTNAKIRYPPVVPWIDTNTRNAIIELFIEVSDADHSAAMREIADLEQRIVQLEGKDILSPVEHRQLHQHRKQMETLQGKLDSSRDKLLEDARAEALNLSLIKGVRQVRVTGQPWERKLLIVTAPIKIGKALLGTYDVIVDPRHTTPSAAIDLVRRDRQREHGPHPHWNSHPCFGTWGPMLSQMLKRKNWSAVVGALLNYLSRYYGQSPLIKLEQFYPGGYYENHSPTV